MIKHKLYLLLIFIIGVINFLPIIGLFSAVQLTQTYDIELVSNELEVLMRHRALLFGILGGFVFCSLFKPNLRAPALIMTGVSMVGFLYLVWSVGGINEAVMKVTMVDVAGIVCLLLAMLLNLFKQNKRQV